MPKTETLLLFGTLLCRGLKVILRIGLNLTCLGSVGLTTEKFPVASRRAQSLDHSLFTRTIFLMSLAWLNLYCLLMIQIFFVLIRIPTTLFLFANNELKVRKWLVGLRWFDIVFQGQYLPSLSVNYVAISKDLEKLTPQLY